MMCRTPTDLATRPGPCAKCAHCIAARLTPAPVPGTGAGCTAAQASKCSKMMCRTLADLAARPGHCGQCGQCIANRIPKTPVVPVVPVVPGTGAGCTAAQASTCSKMMCRTPTDLATRPGPCAKCAPCIAARGTAAAACNPTLKAACDKLACQTMGDRGLAKCKSCHACATIPLGAQCTADMKAGCDLSRCWTDADVKTRPECKECFSCVFNQNKVSTVPPQALVPAPTAKSSTCTPELRNVCNFQSCQTAGDMAMPRCQKHNCWACATLPLGAQCPPGLLSACQNLKCNTNADVQTRAQCKTCFPCVLNGNKVSTVPPTPA